MPRSPSAARRCGLPLPGGVAARRRPSASCGRPGWTQAPAARRSASPSSRGSPRQAPAFTTVLEWQAGQACQRLAPAARHEDGSDDLAGGGGRRVGSAAVLAPALFASRGTRPVASAPTSGRSATAGSASSMNCAGRMWCCRPTPWRACWSSTAAGRNGRRSYAARCWPGAAGRGWLCPSSSVSTSRNAPQPRQARRCARLFQALQPGVLVRSPGRARCPATCAGRSTRSAPRRDLHRAHVRGTRPCPTTRN